MSEAIDEIRIWKSDKLKKKMENKRWKNEREK
jgi:hypothetical protein